MRERGVSFKRAVNDAIRAGHARSKPQTRAFQQETFPLGAEQYFRWDKALSAADAIEDEEIIRKLSVQK